MTIAFLVLKIFLILLVCYIVFLFFPSFFGYMAALWRSNGKRMTKETMQGTYYEPCEEKILEAVEYIRKLPQEEVEISAFDGILLRGTFVSQGAKKTIILSHGFKANYMEQLSYQAKLFYERGFNVLFICHRAHDVSGGKISSLGIRESRDIIDWVKFVSNRGQTEILLYGVSMGCTSIFYALDGLKDSNVKCAVCDCGYPYVYQKLYFDIVRWHMPAKLMAPHMAFAARILQRTNLKASANDCLAQTKIPLFFIHGQEDETVPYREGEEAYKLCQSEKEWHLVPGAGHIVSLPTGGEALENSLMQFVNHYIMEE